MGNPSAPASNAILYVTYSAFLLIGLGVAWTVRKQTKIQYLASNRTQTGIPLALNFIAAGLGSGILFTYPQVSTVAGVQGLIVYALSSSLPFFAFAWLGPILRRKCPEGFLLTEWTRQRYGVLTSTFLSFMTLITLFLYMVAELSALQQIVNLLTDNNGLPAVIIECAVTTIYTSVGGFKVSFITDNIQGAMVLGLMILGIISIGVEVRIDRSLVDKSGYLDASLLGWQLMYILPVAILTNDFFVSSFWMRTFASRTDRDLWIGISIATVCVTIILIVVGVTGLLATWSGALQIGSQEGYTAFFILLQKLPTWVVGVILVMVVALSTSAFDSFQSAMVSTGSNDLFRNKLSLWWIRASVVVVIVPVVVVALKSPNILQVYLISDLVSSAVIPVLILGLWDKMWWWRGFEVVVGGLGGILTVFLFGTVYYGNAAMGARLILLEQGLYSNDWGAFGAFVAAPIGGVFWAISASIFRITCQWLIAKWRKENFTALDKPDTVDEPQDDTQVDGEPVEVIAVKSKTGKFF